MKRGWFFYDKNTGSYSVYRNIDKLQFSEMRHGKYIDPWWFRCLHKRKIWDRAGDSAVFKRGIRGISSYRYRQVICRFYCERPQYVWIRWKRNGRDFMLQTKRSCICWHPDGAAWIPARISKPQMELGFCSSWRQHSIRRYMPLPWWKLWGNKRKRK